MYWIFGKKTILCFSVILLCCATVFGLYGRSNDKLADEQYSADCSYTLSAWIFTINAICIQKKQLPQLSLVNIVNEVWNQIEWFSGYYNPLSQSFDYYGANPIFSTNWNPYLRWDDEANLLVSEAIKSRKKVSFTYTELAQYYAKHLSYFVSDKDLTNLKKCTRTNYLIALEWIDGVIMNPWDDFNVNTKLGSLKWYCEWQSEWAYSFYGWVCGMVSQLFRVSLLDPDILITKRFSHDEWFVQYYWETVWGDDAAVYEYSKQFEIKNLWNSDIIFKVRHEWNYSILVAISWPTNEWVKISKHNIDWRKKAIHLNKTVYKSGNVIREENFDSYYRRKTYEFR